MTTTTHSRVNPDTDPHPDDHPENGPDRGAGTDMDPNVRAFIEWLASLDDDDPNSPGRQDRRTVTLQQITDRAKALL